MFPSQAARIIQGRDRSYNEEDSTLHTLVCRQAFVRRIGDLRPGDLVARTLESLVAWDVVVRFAQNVMSPKEGAKRAKQREEGVAPFRRWQAGRAALDRIYYIKRVSLCSFLF